MLLIGVYISTIVFIKICLSLIRRANNQENVILIIQLYT